MLLKLLKVVDDSASMRLLLLVNKEGIVGSGLGKAKEVSDAIQKGNDDAKKNLIRVPIAKGGTIHFPVTGKCGAGRVLLLPASEGTGVIAGGAVKAVLESAGYHNILSKSLGSSNPHNMVKATVDALKQLVDPGRNSTTKRNPAEKSL